MPNIRYVCLSDLHLGQNDGLLTNLSADRSTIDVSKPSPVLVSLCQNLRELIEANSDGAQKPTLILNGDVLEIAFAKMNIAAMAFERFIELILPADKEPLFDRIIFIPGNHDHHCWELARESYYVAYVDTIPAGKPLNDPWHTTNLFIDKKKRFLTGYFLTKLIRRYEHLKNFNIEIAYPNLGLTNSDNTQVALFHHGHYIESLYNLMTTLADLLFPTRNNKPTEIWEIEAENFAWIDFFWSTMGRSGDVGPLVQRIYNSFGDQKALNKRIAVLVKSVVEKINPLGWDEPYELVSTKILQALLGKALDSERAKSEGTSLSEKNIEGLKKYMEGPLLNQVRSELSGVSPRYTFIFGHTHKPFNRCEKYQGFNGNVSLINTGGWVVETIKPSKVHGASAALLDEELNPVYLHFYTEKDIKVRVENASVKGAEELFKHVEAQVKSSNGWKAFSTIVATEITEHEAFLNSKIKE